MDSSRIQMAIRAKDGNRKEKEWSRRPRSGNDISWLWLRSTYLQVLKKVLKQLLYKQDSLKLSVESEGSVNCPNVVSLKLQTLDARVQRDRQHLGHNLMFSCF